MKKGFTLAEILITLGIIGIIAAITLPSVINKYKEKVTLHKLENTYSLLANAYNEALFEYGTPDTWPNKNVNGMGVAEIFAKKLRLTDICLTTSVKCHLNTKIVEYMSLNGFDTGSYKYLVGTVARLNDMKIIFYFKAPECRGWSEYSWDSVTKQSPYYHACGTISVDINGNNKPNRYGVDLFQFIFTDSKIVPGGTPPTPYYNLRTACNPTMTTWDGSVNGSFCTAWLLIKKNMNYLREEVNW